MAALDQFQREVFLGATPVLPAVGAAPPDMDGDGVYDSVDLCRATPRGANVDTRGCWVVGGLQFATDSDVIEDSSADRLNDVRQPD